MRYFPLLRLVILSQILRKHHEDAARATDVGEFVEIPVVRHPAKRKTAVCGRLLQGIVNAVHLKRDAMHPDLVGAGGFRFDGHGVDVFEQLDAAVAVGRLEQRDPGVVAIEANRRIGPFAADRVTPENREPEVGEERDRLFDVTNCHADVLKSDAHERMLPKRFEDKLEPVNPETRDGQATPREARRGDEEGIQAGIRALAEYEREPDAVENSTSALTESLFGKNPRVFCHVVDINGRIAGIALWFVTYSTWTGKHGAWLEDLYVYEEFRGRGYGKALITHLATECVKRGHSRLEWTPVDSNRVSGRGSSG